MQPSQRGSGSCDQVGCKRSLPGGFQPPCRKAALATSRLDHGSPKIGQQLFRNEQNISDIIGKYICDVIVARRKGGGGGESEEELENFDGMQLGLARLTLGTQSLRILFIFNCF